MKLIEVAMIFITGIAVGISIESIFKLTTKGDK